MWRGSHPVLFYCVGFVCEYFSFLIHFVISIVAAIDPFYYVIAVSSKLSLHQPAIFSSSSPLWPPVEGCEWERRELIEGLSGCTALESLGKTKRKSSIPKPWQQHKEAVFIAEEKLAHILKHKEKVKCFPLHLLRIRWILKLLLWQH